MRKKILLFIVLILVSKVDVFALKYGGCSYSDVARLKNLLNNINISYDYHIKNNVAYFDVTLDNIPKEIYLVDGSTNKTYTNSSFNNGELTIKNHYGNSAIYKFYSSLNECYGISIGIKYYTFPVYNVYYGDKLCSDIPNYSLCQKWVSVNYSRSKFEEMVSQYKKGTKPEKEEKTIMEYEKTFLDKLIDIYAQYYYLFLIGIILISGVIILIKNKKEKFDL